MARVWRGGAAMLAAVLGSACYVYVPAGDPAPPVGEAVRVLVQPAAAERLSGEAGRPMPSLEGRVVETAQDTLRVSVVIQQNSGASIERPRQVFSVASSEVLQVQREELSVRRTVLLGAGSVALLAVLISRFDAIIGGDPGDDSYPGDIAPAIFRVPVGVFLR